MPMLQQVKESTSHLTTEICFNIGNSNEILSSIFVKNKSDIISIYKIKCGDCVEYFSKDIYKDEYFKLNIYYNENVYEQCFAKGDFHCYVYFETKEKRQYVACITIDANNGLKLE